ncbi:PREDICTED: uncharacterized protein LOC108564143 [Nicrophorus vespilloides]|uniref:Uncharacterized protein LOC108564143 n=1 Tax=Nicrophorus vespilloides TaxID=110193 RepID=A0ABM1MVG9_NICVS|nr:PREDICTED: uncharacterized protein LOC108564143 [Nicrophorus vespilloides]
MGSFHLLTNFSLNYFFIIQMYILGQDICTNMTTESTPKLINTSTTTLRLINSDSQNYNFIWYVKPKRKVQCKNVQRCNIMAWEGARKLQKFLSNYKVDTANPHIVIDNEMMMSGVEYTLNLTIYNGSYLSNKEFILPMNETETENTNVEQSIQSKIFGIIRLVGLNETFADAEYSIRAEVVLCATEDLIEYSIQWELLDKSGNSLKKILFTGNTLRLEAYTFQAPGEYIINCTLVSNNNLLNANHIVRVLSQGLMLKLNTKSLLIGTDESIKLIAFVNDLDHKKPTFNLEWFCNYNDEPCNYFEVNTAVMELDDGFLEPGRYDLTIHVSNENSEKNETCRVIISDDVNRTLELNEIKDIINPTEVLEIVAKISKLITGCLVSWESLTEDTYESLDLEAMPDFEGVINVTVKDDAFLDELVEFSNDTIDKEYSLIIPPKTDSWEGLKENASYLFRLNVSCPTSIANEFDLVQAEFEITTDWLPKVKSFTVQPDTGEALKTMFKFSAKTEQPNLFLSFGYHLNNFSYYFHTVGGVDAETFLPFSETGIHSILKACNSRKTCSVIDGPIIQVRKPDIIAEADLTKFKSGFSQSLSDGDYKDAFISATNYLTTIKSFDNDLLVKDIESFTTDSIDAEINLLIEKENLEKSIGNTLIKEVKDFSRIVKLPENVLLSLVKLRGKLADEMHAKIVTDYESYNLRLSSNSITKDIDFENFKEYLEVSELVITNSKDNSIISNEKNNLLNNIEKFSAQLCAFVYKGQKINIELKTFTFIMEKLTRNYFKNYVAVPKENNVSKNFMRITFNQNWFSEVYGQKFCVGKGIFNDYLNKKGIVYLVNIYNYIGNVPLQNAVIMLSSQPKQICSVYTNHMWENCSHIHFNGKEHFCDCRNLGYYRLKTIEDKNDEIVEARSTLRHEFDIRTTAKSPELILKAVSALDNGDKISLAVIATSVFGMVILAIFGVIYNRVKRKRTVETVDVLQFPRYADVYREDILDSNFN